MTEDDAKMVERAAKRFDDIRDYWGGGLWELRDLAAELRDIAARMRAELPDTKPIDERTQTAELSETGKWRGCGWSYPRRGPFRRPTRLD